MVKTLTIAGLRGFGKEQTLSFSLPNGKDEGSGLTIIVGANNSGKTTITEAIKSFVGYSSPSFSEGKRNARTNQHVVIKATNEKDEPNKIESINDSSETRRNKEWMFYVVPSRRSMQYEFGKSNMEERQNYLSNSGGFGNQRLSNMESFQFRIMKALNEKEKLDTLLNQILGYNFEWTVDQRENGNNYIKCKSGSSFCSSEGIGDGIWSVFVIAISLFDSSPGDSIIIDEPELSIHPAIQKRLMSVFNKYSRDRQIIISTHSSYFIDWQSIINGATLIRVSLDNEHNSICHKLGNTFSDYLKGIINNFYNPHILGLEAKEAFFLEDNIIVVEGQDDVVFYQKIASQLQKEISGSFFGWGAGGASRIEPLLQLLSDLGYQHVVGIYDGDKKEEFKKAEQDFPKFKILMIKEDDVRDKRENHVKEKKGLVTLTGEIKEECKSETINLINDINMYFLT